MPTALKLEDAKARFSEGAGEFDRLVSPEPALPLVAYMESLHVDGLDLARDPDRGRDAPS